MVQQAVDHAEQLARAGDVELSVVQLHEPLHASATHQDQQQQSSMLTRVRRVMSRVCASGADNHTGRASLCPPGGCVERCCVSVLLCACVWLLSVCMTGNSAVGWPGGQLFGLQLLLVAGLSAGWLVARLRLPPLLGMLAVGLAAANIDWLRRVAAVDVLAGAASSANIRSVALAVILTRAGLGLDTTALRRLSAAVGRLAFTPCVCEALVVTLAAHLVLAMPWSWAAMLGFVLSAVSPAVVVPGLLALQRRGYGVRQGVPTLVIAAASVDDVLAITCFGVMFGLTFTQGSVGSKILSGIVELVLGVSYGVVCGVTLWYLPGSRNSACHVLRVSLLSGLALLAIFGSRCVGYAGAGALGCLILAFVASHGWKSRDNWTTDNDPASSAFCLFWFIFEPLLFVLIGAELNMTRITGHVTAGLLVLATGLFVRLAVTYLAVFGCGLSLSERVFVAIAWLPKATVQAAIGPLALDYARNHAPSDENIALAQEILTMAVLAILVTAPLGAAGITVAGPRLLTKSPSTAAAEPEHSGHHQAEHEQL